MQFMQTRSLGFSNDHILVLRAPDVIEDRQQYSRSLRSFKAALLKEAAIQRVSLSSSVPGEPVPWYQQARQLQGGGTDERTTLFVATIDHDYWQTYGIRLVAGINYAAQHEADPHHILLNETAVRAVGFSNPSDAVGQQLVLSRDTLTVLGVVADYHHTSPKQEVDPTAYRLTDVESTYFSVAIAPGAERKVIAKAEVLYRQFFDGVPLEYFFARDWYDRQYDGDRQFSFVFNTFAALAVLIAALGLFGLASFTITQRTREVGVRKVLGSTVQQIVLLFSRDFLKLVLAANALAVPLAWWALESWLQTFATRVAVGYGVFVGVLILSVVIAWAAIGYHAVRSALTNPVQALRQD
jgi:putative ABC transport system permease protein